MQDNTRIYEKHIESLQRQSGFQKLVNLVPIVDKNNEVFSHIHSDLSLLLYTNSDRITLEQKKIYKLEIEPFSSAFLQIPVNRKQGPLFIKMVKDEEESYVRGRD